MATISRARNKSPAASPGRGQVCVISTWGHNPRGAATLGRRDQGKVTVRCNDGLEMVARQQELTAAANFLRSFDGFLPPTAIPAHLIPPFTDRKIPYAISLGARVSIARASERPLVA